MAKGQTRYGHVFSKGGSATAWVGNGSHRGARKPQPDPLETALMAGPERLGIMLTSGGLRNLTLVCGDCGHKASKGRDEALEIFGSSATPMQIARRIKCSKCGSKRCWPTG